ncbi:hypothetical protein ABCS02_08885 [Microbacterium sp. X-17]|uniref:hypothetical protein n=1 Tax=Microbacterium sp. X-17 TaxID=3144404 RepID=UPI0031F4F022
MNAQGIWRSLRWPLAFSLATASAVAAAGAVVAIGSHRVELGILAQTLTFVVSPVLAALALGIASGSRRRSLRVPSALMAIGLGFAGAAHLVWYRLVDDEMEPSFGGPVWLALILLSVALFTATVVSVLAPALRRSRLSRLAAIGLPAIAGIIGGLILIGFLATFFGAAILALLTIAAVILMHRTGRRRALRAA